MKTGDGSGLDVEVASYGPTVHEWNPRWHQKSRGQLTRLDCGCKDDEARSDHVRREFHGSWWKSMNTGKEDLINAREHRNMQVERTR